METLERENIKAMEEWMDDLLDFPISTPPDAKYYHIRAAQKYCEERGISIEDISDEELKQFEYVPR